MSSPTAEIAPTEEYVSAPEPSLLFMARRSELRLVKRPIRTKRDAEGNPIDQTPGQTLEFRDGVLRIPSEQDAFVTLANGEPAAAGEILEWLRKHRLNGDWQEGFWEVDPVAPAPSEREIDNLQMLAVERDSEGLEAFIAQEKAGWNRESLIRVAEGSLERVRAVQRKLALEIEAERQEHAREQAEQGEEA